MIDHTGIGVADVSRSAAFYDSTLDALGLPRAMQLPETDGSDAFVFNPNGNNMEAVIRERCARAAACGPTGRSTGR